ncbi:peptidase U32 family protein [Sporosarcina sp. HYO08]|uniref:peptidase U32 family protein n=1 Tax=Sporosarcina sp. HYO08 TaxID=1759557 RepID=UPI000798121E|nr:peptidase U32 family protein [Sporosarcina sp. HYO08]KXH78782.1 peptidase U32 [Sporosarcina sp. HYO08]
MIELITTAESVDQAKLLVSAGVDTLYIGEEQFGLRLPIAFSQDELQEITAFAHAHQKRVCVAVNALMHNDMIEKVVPYLAFLQTVGVDSITVGDPGVIHLMKKHDITIPYVYDAQTLVTSARQVNFWAKRGAVGAVLAREIPFEELKAIGSQVTVPVEVLVYGATCIHHSKRPLLENYFNFTKETVPSEDLYISEPKKPDTHYSIFEDSHGTHVFATNDLNLLPHLASLVEAGITQWKLDGIFTRGNNFVEIVRLFIEAKRALAGDGWTTALQESLNERVIALHPKERTLDTGFFLKDPNNVK